MYQYAAGAAGGCGAVKRTTIATKVGVGKIAMLVADNQDPEAENLNQSRGTLLLLLVGTALGKEDVPGDLPGLGRQPRGGHQLLHGRRPCGRARRRALACSR